MILKKYALLFLLSTAFSHAIIIETDSILSILTFILQDHCKNRSKLVIFDLDDTIIAPTADIGSSRWVEYMAKKIMEDEGIPFDQAWHRADELNDSILDTMLLKPVEEITPTLITSLQKAGIPVLALTARPKRSAQRTQLQLQMIGVDFSLSPVIPMLKVDLSKKLKTWYEDGIIFSGSSNKGTTLLTFFKTMDMNPKHIIFIDDNKKRVDEVEEALSANGIHCVVFHYTHVRSKKSAFNKEKSDQELGKIHNAKNKS